MPYPDQEARSLPPSQRGLLRDACWARRPGSKAWRFHLSGRVVPRAFLCRDSYPIRNISHLLPYTCPVPWAQVLLCRAGPRRPRAGRQAGGSDQTDASGPDPTGEANHLTASVSSFSGARPSRPSPPLRSLDRGGKGLSVKADGQAVSSQSVFVFIRPAKLGKGGGLRKRAWELEREAGVGGVGEMGPSTRKSGTGGRAVCARTGVHACVQVNICACECVYLQVLMQCKCVCVCRDGGGRRV